MVARPANAEALHLPDRILRSSYILGSIETMSSGPGRPLPLGMCAAASATTAAKPPSFALAAVVAGPQDQR